MQEFQSQTPVYIIVPCSLIAPTGGSSLEKSRFDMKILTKTVYYCTTYDNAKKQSSQEKSTYRRNNENWLVLLTTCMQDSDKPSHTHINFKRPPSPLLIQFQERVERVSTLTKGQSQSGAMRQVGGKRKSKLLSQVTALRLGCLPEYRPCGIVERALDFGKSQKSHHVDLLSQQFTVYRDKFRKSLGLFFQLISAKTGLHDFLGTFQVSVSRHFPALLSTWTGRHMLMVSFSQFSETML